jgi:ribose transport system substrate-binding protein
VVLITTDEAAAAAARPVVGQEAALKALGWRYELFDGRGTPSVYNSDLREAIDLKATAIITTGIDPALVRAALNQARAAGIPVISTAETGIPSVASTPPKTGYDVDVSASEAGMGILMGRYMVCSTKGNLHVLPTQDNEYASSALFINSAVAEIRKCSTCTVAPDLNFVVTEIATTVPGDVVSYLRTHGSINAVLVPYDPVATFVIPALKAAKITNIQTYGEYGDIENLNYIRKGTQAGTAGLPYEWSGWASVDETLRILAHQPMVDEDVPFNLITKNANLPPAGHLYTGNVNYAAHFEALWGLSK